MRASRRRPCGWRSEEHTSELQSRQYLVCRLLLEKKNRRLALPPSRANEHCLIGNDDAARSDRRRCSSRRLMSLPEDEVVFFTDTATTEIYTLSLHDALPI